MRRILLNGLILMIFLSLCGGCKSQRQYEFAQPAENIVRIEIICTPEFSTVSPENLKKMESIITIKSEQWADFLDEFRGIPCFAYFNDPAQTILGNAIRITYYDETCEIICRYSGLYLRPDGTQYYPLRYFDGTEFEAFIKRWWP